MPRVWATLLTTSAYLQGVLVLHWSLRRVGSQYPLVVLYTSQLDSQCLAELEHAGIPTLAIDTLEPKAAPDLSQDPRFHSTWSKLAIFSLVQFDRVVQLDCDMLPIANMDELMDIPLNGAPFASTNACVCNPNGFDHYPANWTSSNCVYSSHAEHMDQACKTHPNITKGSLGPLSSAGLGLCNSGILVVEPNLANFELIKRRLTHPATMKYQFPDQDLLADLFAHQWLSLSYVYNALKTLQSTHPPLWDLSKIKNIHYILSPKPWNVKRGEHSDPAFQVWWDANDARLFEAYS